MKKTLAFAVATVVAGLSAISNVEAANAQIEVNLVIPLVRTPVVHRTYYRETYRRPYYSDRYRQGRVYRYDRDDRYYRGKQYGIYRRYNDSYRHDDDYRH